MATLLEKAKAVPVKPEKMVAAEVAPEEVELFVAMTRGEVTRSQAAEVLALKRGSIEGRRATVFVKAVRAGLLVPLPPGIPASSISARRSAMTKAG